MGALTHPARAPSDALRQKESVRMFEMLIPASIAASGFDAQARMAWPCSEYRKKRCSSATAMPTVPSTQRTCGEKEAPRNVSDEHSFPVK